MPKKRLFRFFLVIFATFSLLSSVRAEIAPEQQMRSDEIQKRDEQLRQEIETPKKVPEKEELPPLPATPESTEKAFIKEIRVSGFTILTDKEIKDIILPFENKELTLGEMQRAANMITDAYRQRGYINSLAYLPPQDIKQEILEIKVVEVSTGEIEIKGNRYFSTSLLRSKIPLKKGEPFNYNDLRKGLAQINRQRDRNARAVLMPGKEPGTTDVVLEVKDRLPIHLGFSMDNLGSRYIGKYRYGLKVYNNNLIGFDDKLSFQFLAGQSDRYYSGNLSYVMPIGSSWDVGLSAFVSQVKLGGALKDSEITGKSKTYSAFARNAFVDTENLDINLNFGYDHKDIVNKQQGSVTSHDRLSVAKLGFDVDALDKFGRTLFTYEFAGGIPDFMGSMSAKDDDASVAGSGGKFVKNTINFLRLQKLPFSTNLLWKNQFQMTPYVLPSIEQFQIGGIANVRGYGPAEAVGDCGLSTTAELSLPVYPIPKHIAVPFSKAKLYDALKLAVFYDWANSHLRKPAAGTKKNATLSSVGFGVRFNLPEDFSVRLDLAWPLDKTPSDSDHLHTWIQVSLDF